MKATAEQDDQGLLRRSAHQVHGLLGRPRSIPYLVVGSTFLLLVLGLLMVWSASSIASIQNGGSGFATLTKQSMFAVLGVGALVFISRLPASVIRNLAWPFLAIVLFMLVLVLIPGIGIEVAGQRNWIGVGGTLRIQPSEFAKLALVLWGAETLARRHRGVTEWRQLLVPVLPVGLLLVALVLAEGDFGNAMILTVILAGMLFVAGAPMRLFAVLGAFALSGLAVLAWIAPYRVQRFTSFLNADADRLDGAWQVTQGMYAFGTGGLFGVGLGGSREKWGTLPAAHTDFIFAVLGEELGLVGTLSVLTLFGLLIFAIFRLVQLTTDPFVQFVATGVGVWLMIQVITNVGATLKLLPITGVTLPMLSYGGSSLIPLLMGIGIVLVLAKQVVHGRGEVRRPSRRGPRTASGADRRTRQVADTEPTRRS